MLSHKSRWCTSLNTIVSEFIIHSLSNKESVFPFSTHHLFHCRVWNLLLYMEIWKICISLCCKEVKNIQLMKTLMSCGFQSQNVSFYSTKHKTWYELCPWIDVQWLKFGFCCIWNDFWDDILLKSSCFVKRRHSP